MQISMNMIILGLVIFLAGYYLSEQHQNKIQSHVTPEKIEVDPKQELAPTPPAQSQVVIYRDPHYYTYPWNYGWYGRRWYYPRYPYYYRRYW